MATVNGGQPLRPVNATMPMVIELSDEEAKKLLRWIQDVRRRKEG